MANLRTAFKTRLLSDQEKRRALFFHKPECPYCQRATALLKEHDVKVVRMNVHKPSNHKLMLRFFPGAKTVPQIFWHVGGHDDLVPFLALKSL
jgi:glutaredoxin